MQYEDEFLSVYRHERGSKHSYFDKKSLVLTKSNGISIKVFSGMSCLLVQHLFMCFSGLLTYLEHVEGEARTSANSV